MVVIAARAAHCSRLHDCTSACRLPTGKAVVHGGAEPRAEDDWGMLRNVPGLVRERRPEPLVAGCGDGGARENAVAEEGDERGAKGE